MSLTSLDVPPLAVRPTIGGGGGGGDIHKGIIHLDSPASGPSVFLIHSVTLADAVM